jgi:hypothetical protein
VRRLTVVLAAAILLAAACTDTQIPDSNVSGQGWRLLGEGGVGVPNTVEVFDTLREYEFRWSVDEAPPAVDYDTEVVVRFSPATRNGGRACREARLENVVIDTAAALVYAVYKQFAAEGCEDGPASLPLHGGVAAGRPAPAVHAAGEREPAGRRDRRRVGDPGRSRDVATGARQPPAR